MTALNEIFFVEVNTAYYLGFRHVPSQQPQFQKLIFKQIIILG